HAEHWRSLLGNDAKKLPRPSLHRALLRFLARMFGSVFVLALMQRAESDTPYNEILKCHAKWLQMRLFTRKLSAVLPRADERRWPAIFGPLSSELTTASFPT